MIKLLMNLLIWSSAILFVAKVFGWITASWWLVLAPFFVAVALVAISVFLVAVVYND